MGKAAKTEHCKTCPAYEADGRCLGLGPANSHVVFLSGSPKEEVKGYEYRSFADSVGSFFIGLLEELQKKHDTYKHLRYYLLHASQCIQEKETAEVIEHCRQIVHKQIVFSGAGVVVAMGASACKSLGITGSMSEVRGKIFDMTIAGKKVKVVPTFNPGALLRKENTGLLATFNQDMKKALGLAISGGQVTSMKEMTKDYRMAKTVAEGRAILREILDYYAEATAAGRPTLLAVDSETTGLKTYVKDFRVIALSFSWAQGKSAALLLNHREMKDDWRELLPEVRELLGSDMPKTLHNFQYDFKAIELSLGVEMKNVAWDSMFAEYLLDENKQGLYGLKQIVKARVPEFTDYEKRVKEQLGASEDVDTKLQAARLKGKELTATKKVLVAEKKVAPDRAAKALVLAKIKDVTDEARDLRGETARLRAKQIEDKSIVKTYEDIDVDDLLFYAAIDTDCTRRVTVQQYVEMDEEDEELIDVLRALMIPAARTLGRMEHEGIRIDLDYLTFLEGEFQKIADETKDQVFRAIGYEINLNSTAELIKVFTQKYGVTFTKKTKKGKTAVDKAVLEELGKTNDVAKKILRHRKALKAKDTFLKGIRDGCMEDGRIHASYKLTGTATGRLSSSNPNCLSMDTQVLTKEGWKTAETLAECDEVGCFDAETKELRWDKPTKVYISQTQEHEMVRLKNEHFDWHVTANHRCLFVERRTAKPIVKAATKIPRDAHVLHGAVLAGGEQFFAHPSHLQLMVAVQADAHECSVNTYDFSFKKERKYRRLLELLKEASLRFEDRSTSTIYRVMVWVPAGFWKGCLAAKHFTYGCLQLSYAEKMLFLAELRHWDGSNTRAPLAYCSKSEVNVDVVQAIASLCGWRAHKVLQKNNTGRWYFHLYCVPRGYSGLANSVVTQETETCQVWCLEVPTGFFLVRRGGDTFITGNCQNIPARGLLGYNVKKLFLPDTVDEVFVNMDYSGAEIRVLTAYAHDKALIDTLNEGLNIHSFVGSQIFSTPYEEIEARALVKESDPERYLYLDQCRQTAKTTVFLTIYGGGAETLFTNLVKAQPKITIEECQDIITRFLDSFPIIRNYMETVKRQVDRQCFVKSKFGRRRRFPLAKVDWKLRNASYREGINFPVQSTSSDLVLSQLVEMDGLRHVIGLKPRVTVHDSIGFSVHKDRVSEVRAFLDRYAQERITEKFPWLPVPFEYEAEYGPSYGECKTVIKK